jgi:hypothetical protein
VRMGAYSPWKRAPLASVSRPLVIKSGHLMILAPDRWKDGSVATSRNVTYLILLLGLLGGIVAGLAPWSRPEQGPAGSRRIARKPPPPSGLDGAPPEVREFLDRVLERVPEGGTGATGYQFHHWAWEGKPTHEAVGLKAIPGVEPREAIARVMDVDGYTKHLAHVATCRSVLDPAAEPPKRVRLFQVVRIPGIARVQQELLLVDAGTVKGYRVAYWYLLEGATDEVDAKTGARSAFNVGAWLVAPGVVGYALSTWPRRGDVNALQWISLTSGADALAERVVEGNIDGLAAWAMDRAEAGPTPR